MKRIITIIFLISCFFDLSFAQNTAQLQPIIKRKWQPVQLNFGLGVDWNHYNSMSLEQLMIFAKQPEQLQRDLRNLTEEATTITAGLTYAVSVSLAPLNYSNGTYKENQELRLGFAIYSPKEAMVSYKNQELDTSIVFCNLHEELALEGAYMMKGQWGKRKRLHWYIGAGLNFGFTFSNEMMLISGQYFEPGQHPSTQEGPFDQQRYEAKTVYYSRLYIPYGIHYQISKSWLLGFDFRKGIGMQIIKGEQVNYIKKAGSFHLGAKYLF